MILSWFFKNGKGEIDLVLKNSMKQNVCKENVSKSFILFHSTSVNGTAMLMAAVIASYFAVFMTDTIKIPAATASAIMLIATFWDAVNDPMMGIMADRTRTKWGRYRVYFIIAPILLTVFGTAIWINPDLPLSGKVAYVLICYIGYGMTVTMYTMPQMSILPAYVEDNKKRNMIISLGAGCTAAMFTVGSTFTPQLKNFFENLFNINNGYVPLMLVCGILACVSFWGLFASSKERYVVNVEKRPIFKDLKMILRHKELSVFVVVWIMASVGYGLMFASSVYYIMYYIKRPDLISYYMGIVSVGALLSMVVIMPIALKILKTARKALVFSQVGAIICYIILFFFAKNSLLLLYVLTFIATSFSTMQNALVNILVNDTIDYIQLKEGISANGVISSIKGFAQKCGNTITNSGILAVLAISGYVAGAVGNQNEATMFAINFLRFGAPSITGLILIIALRFNPVEKYYGEIENMKENMKKGN
jgi:sugar (glycoside-pentoside-hexuronide) transporter